MDRQRGVTIYDSSRSRLLRDPHSRSRRNLLDGVDEDKENRSKSGRRKHRRHGGRRRAAADDEGDEGGSSRRRRRHRHHKPRQIVIQLGGGDGGGWSSDGSYSDSDDSYSSGSDDGHDAGASSGSRNSRSLGQDEVMAAEPAAEGSGLVGGGGGGGASGGAERALLERTHSATRIQQMWRSKLTRGKLASDPWSFLAKEWPLEVSTQVGLGVLLPEFVQSFAAEAAAEAQREVEEEYGGRIAMEAMTEAWGEILDEVCSPMVGNIVHSVIAQEAQRYLYTAIGKRRGPAVVGDEIILDVIQSMGPAIVREAMREMVEEYFVQREVESLVAELLAEDIPLVASAAWTDCELEQVATAYLAEELRAFARVVAEDCLAETGMYSKDSQDAAAALDAMRLVDAVAAKEVLSSLISVISDGGSALIAEEQIETFADGEIVALLIEQSLQQQDAELAFKENMVVREWHDGLMGSAASNMLMGKLSDLLAWYEDAEHKRDIWVQAYAKKQLQRHMRQAGLDLLESERSKDVRKLKGWMDSEDGRAATTEKRPVSAARRKAAAQIAAQNGA